MATGKNPIAVGDLHGFLHRNGEGTEQLRKRFDISKENEIFILIFIFCLHMCEKNSIFAR